MDHGENLEEFYQANKNKKNMIILKADNRTITENTKYTYLSDNTVSGVTSLTVSSTSGFSVDDYILVGDFGQESSEILKIATIASATQLTVTTSTSFSHSESTVIRRVLYNQVRFYKTTTTTFSAGSPLGTVNIDPQSLYTSYEDNSSGTGYGWFIFLNGTTGLNSSPSNPIPYAGFDDNSAKSIIEQFLSSISNSDAKLISFEEAFRWLSEGYALAYNELNLVNQEYTTEDVKEINIVSGTQEYSLPTNFSKMVSISDGDGADLDYIKQRDIREYLNANSGASRLNQRHYDVGSSPRYYIRGSYIGFVPIPTENTTYYLYYNAKSGVLTSYYDNIVLPNNNYYCMQDFLKYRATDKLDRSNPERYYKLFMNSINQMKVNSVKQNANRDSWDITPESNI